MSGLMTKQDPAVLRRRLCRHLVQLRGERPQREVAEALDWSPSKVLRIENGAIGVAPTDLRALLALYGVSNPALVEMLVHMAKESRHSVASPYADVLDPEMVFYLRFEVSASALRQYHPYLIPGLLQTEEYARAVIDSFADPQTPAEVRERQLEARLARQAVLGRVRSHFILDESALRRRVDDDGVTMRGQLTHIVELSRRGNVTIQVLPFGAGLCRGAQWPFVLLDFPDADDDTLLYLEGRDTRVTRDDPAELARHEAAFAELSSAAIPDAELPAVIAGLLAER
jgi:transcriptional regulator with XRE-family HTH domain